MNDLTIHTSIRLTELSHGGGCGCKIAPSVLSAILAESPLTRAFPNLMVGTENSDDAAVYRLNDQQALVATTDFFMPIVDDPFEFGRIAATNALSDIYAMGGTPIMALAIVGMPINKLPVETIQRIIAGGEAVCAAAGIPIAGGHSIDSPEPIYGLVGLGLVHPDQVKRNDSAAAGDALILAKPIGVGILSAALKKGKLSVEGYAAMIQATTQLNKPGIQLAIMPGVHALTDVTGFGLLGHLLEMCRGATLTATLNYAAIPMLPLASDLAQQGYITGASDRNWQSYQGDVLLPAGMADWQRSLLADPQTSGGLLVACSASSTDEILTLFRESGFASASVIGSLRAGPAKINVL